MENKKFENNSILDNQIDNTENFISRSISDKDRITQQETDYLNSLTDGQLAEYIAEFECDF